ncbi:MAG: hypothetical protein KY468_04995 [Armatimonadetes bacterium]|nr:hypothetical protein [Armatimonadota bacterium]
MPIPERYREAFKENFNVLGLASLAAASAAMLNPLPLLAGLVAEAAYLLFVPDSKWYEARLARRHDAEVIRRQQDLMNKLFPLLRPETQQRFQRLVQLRRDIEKQPMAEEKWFRDVLRKLDYLLEKFLMFAAREVQFRSYLQSILEEVRGEKEKPRPVEPARRRSSRAERIPSMEEQILGLFFPGILNVEIEEDDEDHRRRRVQRQREKEWPPPAQEHHLPRHLVDPWIKDTVAEIQARYDQDRKNLDSLLEQEQDFHTKAVLEKRKEVLRRRHEFVEKMGKILINLNHQLELLEDTFGLISDEIRAHPPEQVLADIDEVVWQTNAMTQVLEQIAPYESGS